ncbi:hypothetical protein GCM10009530_59940 [Microbispora corallina]|uniref:XRE family transcriptional regulator n=1 Tax=Microbispora corallina TaxID=83302 RepID=A0ABQ4GA29_9ACTN|nr:helix-turn-helix transcriptional regulator [Microbispora corallina]GIH43931.1 hypothetical protein Mco01_69310 [Microbispora corallina]
MDERDRILAEFAARLAALRVEAGEPSLRDLERLTEQAGHRISRSTLAEILEGRRLPSIDQTAAFAKACSPAATREQVKQELLTERGRARARLQGKPVPPEDLTAPQNIPVPQDVAPALARGISASTPPAVSVSSPAVPVSAPRSGYGRRRWWLAGAGALLVAGVVGASATLWLQGHSATGATQGSTRTGMQTIRASASVSNGPSGAAGLGDPGPVWTGKPPVAFHAEWDTSDGPAYWFDGSVDQYTDQSATQGRVALSTGGGDLELQVTAQGRTQQAVLLQRMEIKVTKRTPAPTRGIRILCGQCGEGQTSRYFDADFARDPITLTARPGRDGFTGKKQPAVTFPYSVNLTEQEFFVIYLRHVYEDCTFNVVLHWIADGKKGITVLDDGGRGFRVVGGGTLPAFRRDYAQGRPTLTPVSS